MAGQEADPGASAQGSVFQPLEADDPAELGDYVLTARLGAGGMGTVYLSHTLAGRPVAIKAIRPELAGDPDFRRRFRQEVAAARRVHGLYTAPVIDSEIDTPPLWLATAFVQGPTLAAAVSRHGTLPVASVLLLAAGVAEALQAVHGEGIVHRDLKASNVLLATDGPRVIDFGIARAVDATALTKAGVAVGTPPFMSPEQALDREIGPATDIFSLGQLVTYAAKGTPAFGEGQSHGVLYRIVHEEPDLADVPGALLPLLRRCLAKDPAERPSPAEVIRLCRAASEGGVLRRTGTWLPEAVTAEITRHHDVPSPPATGRQPVEEVEPDAAEPADAAEPDAADAAEPTHPATAPATAPAERNPATASPGNVTTGPAEQGERTEPAKPAEPPGPPGPAEPAPSPSRTPPADTPQPAGKPTRRRALLALGATVLAGAGGAAALIGLREDPGKITVRTAETIPVPKEAGIWKVSFSPDGKTLATSGNGDVGLWDVATGESAGSLTDPGGTTSSVAFGPDSGILATGGSDEARLSLWNVDRKKVTASFPTGHGGGVWVVVFSPDGRTLATAGDDSKVRLWDVATRERIGTLSGHESDVRAVAFSPDGGILATGSLDNTIRLWTVSTRERITTLSGHKDGVWSVAFSPDGDTLATGGADKTVRLWDVAAREHKATLTGHKAEVRAVAFGPDNGTLASAGSDKTVRLWNVATRERAATLTGHKDEIWAVEFTKDGKTLATGGDDKVRLWTASGNARISAARIETQ